MDNSGAQTFEPDLDLANTIRPVLDILANEIVIALKKRSRFARNSAIYEAGLVRTEPDQSLLQYTLTQVERQHAELGRYTFATQDSFTDIAQIEPIILRTPPRSSIEPMRSRVGDKIIAFYRGWINDVCVAGDRPETYGETVTADTDALLAIMERVNLGKSVAESKLREHEAAIRASEGDRDTLLNHIVRADREAAVLAMSERLAERYELPPANVRRVFEFMITTTVDIEVDYLRQRITT